MFAKRTKIESLGRERRCCRHVALNSPGKGNLKLYCLIVFAVAKSALLVFIAFQTTKLKSNCDWPCIVCTYIEGVNLDMLNNNLFLILLRNFLLDFHLFNL